MKGHLPGHHYFLGTLVTSDDTYAAPKQGGKGLLVQDMYAAA